VPFLTKRGVKHFASRFRIHVTVSSNVQIKITPETSTSERNVTFSATTDSNSKECFILFYFTRQTNTKNVIQYPWFLDDLGIRYTGYLRLKLGNKELRKHLATEKDFGLRNKFRNVSKLILKLFQVTKFDSNPIIKESNSDCFLF